MEWESKASKIAAKGSIGNAGGFDGCANSSALVKIATQNHAIRVSKLFNPRQTTNVWTTTLEAILHEPLTSVQLAEMWQIG
jgi:hypothetical protein